MMAFLFMGLLIAGGVLAYVKRCDLFKVDCSGSPVVSPPISNKPVTNTVERWDALTLKKKYGEYMTEHKQFEEMAIKGGATDSLYASSRISYF